MADEGSFFSRWSRRKAGQDQAADADAKGPPAAAAPTAKAAVTPGALPPPAAGEPNTATAGQPSAAPALATGHSASAEAPPPPTLEEAAALTPADDFSRFVRRDVPADVQQTALKRLFSDPHYNIMDGLDTYIDDYHNHVPLLKSELRQMVQARALGLLDDELEEQPGPLPDGTVGAAAAGAQPEATAEPGKGDAGDGGSALASADSVADAAADAQLGVADAWPSGQPTLQPSTGTDGARDAAGSDGRPAHAAIQPAVNSAPLGPEGR